MTTTRDPEEIARELWTQFLATNPGPDFRPWDEMTEMEREVMRSVILSEGARRVMIS